MIVIRKSPTADTRTCDVTKVTENELLESSKQHIHDVSQALGLFADYIRDAALAHDHDKISSISWFFRDFKTGFAETGWWDNHRKMHRHHLNYDDGVPSDVNLMDVLEYIADCTMAGMARSGSVYPIEVSDELLRVAFANTAKMLAGCVKVEGDE